MIVNITFAIDYTKLYIIFKLSKFYQKKINEF